MKRVSKIFIFLLLIITPILPEVGVNLRLNRNVAQDGMTFQSNKKVYISKEIIAEQNAIDSGSSNYASYAEQLGVAYLGEGIGILADFTIATIISEMEKANNNRPYAGLGGVLIGIMLLPPAISLGPTIALKTYENENANPYLMFGAGLAAEGLPFLLDWPLQGLPTWSEYNPRRWCYYSAFILPPIACTTVFNLTNNKKVKDSNELSTLPISQFPQFYIKNDNEDNLTVYVTMKFKF